MRTYTNPTQATYHSERRSRPWATWPKLSLNSGSIGPSHDPYGCETLTVRLEDGREADYYTDGLGTHKLTLWDVYGIAVIEFRWHDSCGWPKSAEDLCNRTKTGLLFKRFMGLDLDEMREQAEHQEAISWDDPMGHPSSYI